MVTGMLYFNRNRIVEAQEQLGNLWHEVLGLDYASEQRYRDEFDQSYAHVLQFQ